MSGEAVRNGAMEQHEKKEGKNILMLAEEGKCNEERVGIVLKGCRERVRRMWKAIAGRKYMKRRGNEQEGRILKDNGGTVCKRIQGREFGFYKAWNKINQVFFDI